MPEIRRRDFLIVVGALIGAPFRVEAQQAKAVVIGWFGSGSLASYARAYRDFLIEALRDNGFAVTLESRFAEGKLERLPELADELVRLKPHLIVVADAVSTSALKKATTTVPIIMAGVSDVVGLGLVQSLARPGGNVTGFSSPYGDEFTTKWVELLKAVLPDARRLAVLWNPELPAARRRNEQMQRAARATGIDLVSLEVRSAEDFEQAFKAYRESGAAGLIVDNAPFMRVHATKIQDFALRSRVPTLWGSASGAEGGGLMAYGVDYKNLYRKVGLQAVNILNGKKPADLPVEQPTRYELLVNLKAARAIGITIPPSTLVRADRVIE